MVDQQPPPPRPTRWLPPFSTQVPSPIASPTTAHLCHAPELSPPEPSSSLSPPCGSTHDRGSPFPSPFSPSAEPKHAAKATRSPAPLNATHFLPASMRSSRRDGAMTVTTRSEHAGAVHARTTVELYSTAVPPLIAGPLWCTLGKCTPNRVPHAPLVLLVATARVTTHQSRPVLPSPLSMKPPPPPFP
jgi:hypothetical protein